MDGFELQFFVEQNRRHGHQLLYEWLLETARARGIRGATVFMAAMGFGQHRRIHAAHFLELADQPVEVAMVVSRQEAHALLDFLRAEQVRLFYVMLPAEFGMLGEGADGG